MLSFGLNHICLSSPRALCEHLDFSLTVQAVDARTSANAEAWLIQDCRLSPWPSFSCLSSKHSLRRCVQASSLASLILGSGVRKGTMSSSNLVRWGGLAAMLGGVLWAVWGIAIVVTRASAGVTLSAFSQFVFFIAALLTIGGMVGLHTLQGTNYGRIGRAGFYTAVVALSAQALGALVLLAGSEALEWLIFPVGNLALLVGLVLYGAATLQAGVLPRWCGFWIIVLSPVALFFVAFGGSILFAILWLALGYVLWLRSDTEAQRPSRVR